MILDIKAILSKLYLPDCPRKERLDVVVDGLFECKGKVFLHGFVQFCMRSRDSDCISQKFCVNIDNLFFIVFNKIDSI